MIIFLQRIFKSKSIHEQWRERGKRLERREGKAEVGRVTGGREKWMEGGRGERRKKEKKGGQVNYIQWISILNMVCLHRYTQPISFKKNLFWFWMTKFSSVSDIKHIVLSNYFFVPYVLSWYFQMPDYAKKKFPNR